MAASTFLEPVRRHAASRPAAPGFPCVQYPLAVVGTYYYIDLTSFNSRGQNNLGFQYQASGCDVEISLTMAIPQEGDSDFSKFPWFKLKQSAGGTLSNGEIWNTAKEGFIFGTIARVRAFTNPGSVWIGFQ